MRKQNETLLTVMNVLGWAIFIGLLLMGGGYLVSYGISVNNGSATRDIYMKWDLRTVRAYDFWHYTGVVGMRVVVFVMDAMIALQLAKLMQNLKGENPFMPTIAKRIETVGYMILLTWVAAMLYNNHVDWLVNQGVAFDKRHISGEFVLLAGVAYVFAGVIRKGIALKGSVYTTSE